MQLHHDQLYTLYNQVHTLFLTLMLTTKRSFIPMNLAQPDLRMMEVVSGDNWSYKTYKAPVKSSSTNRHPVFYRPDDLPVTQPTVSGQ